MKVSLLSLCSEARNKSYKSRDKALTYRVSCFPHKVAVAAVEEGPVVFVCCNRRKTKLLI